MGIPIDFTTLLSNVKRSHHIRKQSCMAAVVHGVVGLHLVLGLASLVSVLSTWKHIHAGRIPPLSFSLASLDNTGFCLTL
jgi:hypothetical protein